MTDYVSVLIHRVVTKLKLLLWICENLIERRHLHCTALKESVKKTSNSVQQTKYE